MSQQPSTSAAPAAASTTTTTANVVTATKPPVERPSSFLASLDRRTQELYIRSRALAHLQRSYRQLLASNEEEIEAGRRLAEHNRIAGVCKRRRMQSGGSSGTDASGISMTMEHGVSIPNDASVQSASTAAPIPPIPSTSTLAPELATGLPKLPHIDSSYKLDLTAARPEAGASFLGEPPLDIYSIPGTGPHKRADNRAVISTLVDKSCTPQPYAEFAPGGAEASVKHYIRRQDTSMLFYDLDCLSHHQVRALADFEWKRQWPCPPVSQAMAAIETAAANAASRTAQMTRGAAKRTLAESQQTQEEIEMEAEMDLIRRAFCDKTRASALAKKPATVF
ncbi:hypothetical protein EMMF5_005973 [Cystobasidiomycetes sp. EMM_F5]